MHKEKQHNKEVFLHFLLCDGLQISEFAAAFFEKETAWSHYATREGFPIQWDLQELF